MIALLFLQLLSPAHAEPTDPAAIATLRQETLPDLQRRAAAAKERVKSAEQFFDSKAPLGSAWPELASAPLNEPGYLYGRLQELSDRDEARALERISAGPEGLPKSMQTQRSRALTTAIEAEVRADALERQLLAALVAGLKRAPALQASSVEPVITQWRTLQRAAQDRDPADPAGAEAIRQAREAGEQEVILSRYAQAAVLVMTVPGDLSLARLVRADLTRMAGRSTLEREAALDRIRRVLPLIPTTLAAEAQVLLDDTERTKLTDQLTALAEEETEALAESTRSQLTDAAPEELEEVVATAARELEAARSAASAILTVPPDSELEQLRRAATEQQLRILELRLQTARSLLRKSTEDAKTRDVIDGAAQTQAQVNDAQRLAKEARQRAEDAGKEDLQALIDDLLVLSARMAEAEATRHAQVSGTINHLQEEQRARAEATIIALSAPPALRTEELKQEYVAQLHWLEQLRRRLEERSSSARGLAEKNATIAANELPTPEMVATAAGNDRTLTRDAQGAVEAVQGAMDERLRQANRETDAIARMLRTARTSLRDIREQLSRVDQIAAEREAGIEPLLLAAAELADVPPLLTEKYRTLRELQSWSISSISRQVLIFIVKSFHIILVLLGWHLLRNQGASWIERILRVSQQIIPRSARQQRFDLWIDLDLDGLTTRLGPTIRPAADALAVALIHASISGVSPFLGIFTLLLFIRTMLKLVPHLVNLLVVDAATGTAETRQFALLQTSADILRLITRSAQVVVWWWLLLGMMHYLTYEVLRADMLDAMLSSLTLLIVVALLLREFLRWGPTIQSHIQDLNPTGWLADWMVVSSPSSALTIARAFVGTLYSIAHLTTHLTAMLVEGRGGMNWIGSLIAHHSLKQLNENCPPITAPEREIIRATHQSSFLHDGLVTSIFEEYTRWRAEQRSGMVAVIGSPGAGKTMVMRRTVARLTGDGLPTVQLRPSSRTSESQDVLTWLYAALDLPQAEPLSWSSITDALLEAEPTVFVIDDAHRLLLRAVGGFSALRRLVNLMHATSGQHFWIASFHEQTWGFLESSAVPVSIDLFRARFNIQPLSPTQISEWLRSNTRAAGFDFDFDNLIAGAVLGADPTRSMERVKAAFWRRLADISEGNPQIALQYWLESLHHPAHPELEIAQDPEHASLIPLDVALYTPPFPEIIDALSDTGLFVLAAIVIHDGLSVADLASSLNTSPGLIRVTTRHLQILDVLVIRDGEYRISVAGLPAVIRTLRQRHFLHSLG